MLVCLTLTFYDFCGFRYVDVNSEYKLLFFVCQTHLADYLFTLVSVCSCVCVFHRSVVELLRPQFFTDLHQILHAAQKCGCFERYCFCDKPEIDYRF